MDNYIVISKYMFVQNMALSHNGIDTSIDEDFDVINYCVNNNIEKIILMGDNKQYLEGLKEELEVNQKTKYSMQNIEIEVK